jgi:hypothetical protein
MTPIDRRDHSRLRILWIDVADLWGRILKPRFFGWW